MSHQMPNQPHPHNPGPLQRGQQPQWGATPPPPPKDPNAKPFYKRTWVLVSGVALLALLLGVGIGSGGSVEDSPAYIDAQGALKTANGKVDDLTTQLGEATAQSDANEKQAGELAEQAKALETQKGKLDARKASLDKREKALESAETKAAKKAEMSKIEGDGVYVVGDDIRAGTYKTSGGSDCYWSIAPSVNELDDIVDNNITDGPSVVTVKDGQVLSVERCGDWERQ